LPRLRQLLDAIALRLAAPSPDEDAPDPIDAEFRDLPSQEWAGRATVEVLRWRGFLVPGVMHDPADRVAGIADLAPVERSHRLRALVEEERSLAGRNRGPLGRIER
jgi:hypothetical protein